MSVSRRMMRDKPADCPAALAAAPSAALELLARADWLARRAVAARLVAAQIMPAQSTTPEVEETVAMSETLVWRALAAERRTTGSTRNAYALLALKAGTDGLVAMSHAELSALLNLTPQATRDVMQRLRRARLIVTVRRGRLHQSALYRVLVPADGSEVA